mmetsp:Transcript_2473/g.3617  ORF Transcript_2473/g.3617 Transcript_2473/m.3617 type:complete len:641 (-) Transcript_2473:107-2029(-)
MLSNFLKRTITRFPTTIALPCRSLYSIKNFNYAFVTPPQNFPKTTDSKFFSTHSYQVENESISFNGKKYGLYSYRDIHNLILSLGDHRKWQMILDVIETIELHGIEINEGVLLKSFRVLCDNGRAQDAMGLFHRFDRTDCDKTSKVKAINMAVRAFAAKGDLDSMFKVLFKMETFRPEISTYRTALSGLLKSNKPKASCIVLDKMKESGMELESIDYGFVLVNLLKKKLLPIARKLYNEIKEKNFTIEHRTYQMMVDKFSAAGEYDDVVRLLEDMKKDGFELRGSAWIKILVSLSLKGENFPLLFEKVKQMKEAGYKPIEKIYFNLISNAVVHGELEDVTKLSELLLEDFISPNIYSLGKVINTCADQGKPEIAEMLFDLFCVKNEVVPNVYVFANLLKCYTRCPSYERAQYWFQKMIDHGLPNDQIVYTLLMTSAAEEGKLEEVLKMVDNMAKENFEMNEVIQKVVIKAYIKADQMERAEQYAQEVSDTCKDSDLGVYFNIIKGYFMKGDREKVLEWFDKAMSSDKKLTPVFFNSAFKILLEIGSHDRIESMWNASKKTYLKMGASNYNLILQFYAGQGKLYVADSILGSMVKRGLNMNKSSFKVLIDGFEKRGNAEKAEYWKNKMDQRFFEELDNEDE